MKMGKISWRDAALALVIAACMLMGLSGCNNPSSADTETKLNESAALQLVSEYFSQYPHTLLEDGPDGDLEWYYPAEIYRQNIKLKLLKVKVTGTGPEKDALIPFRVDLLASVAEHKNIDHYPGKLLNALPEKFTRVRVFYFGMSDIDRPFIQDTAGRSVSTL